jgi:thymidylate kinase
MSQKIIIVDGPDGCGKTEISKAISQKLGIPYYKFAGERKFWEQGNFLDVLHHWDPARFDLFDQCGYSIVMDRSYPSEWVYSLVFGRETDKLMLEHIDDWAARLKTTIIIPQRRDYSKNRDDDLVPNDKLQQIHDVYSEFFWWTRCHTIKMFVDDLDNDLEKELDFLEEKGIFE